MPRRARVQSKSRVYHVMMRGNERKNIFLNDEDKAKFLDILYEKKKGSRFYLYAYCLMDNHIHLVISENKDSIARIMKRVNTSYAYYFNKRYIRVGHLFQDRFKSEPIENDEYLLTAARYVHNNPIKANMVERVEDYKWSSYKLYLEFSKYSKIIDKHLMLEIFSKDRLKAIEALEEFTNKSNVDEFLEYEEDDIYQMNEDEAKDFIANYLKVSNIGTNLLKVKDGIGFRTELIKELKQKSNLSIRNIAKLLGITKGRVQEVKT